MAPGNPRQGSSLGDKSDTCLRTAVLKDGSVPQLYDLFSARSEVGPLNIGLYPEFLSLASKKILLPYVGIK